MRRPPITKCASADARKRLPYVVRALEQLRQRLDGSSRAQPPRARGWYLYDWANSAFATTTVALFLGPYLTALAKDGGGCDGLVHPLGLTVDARSYWSYLVSLSVILQVLVLPLVGAVADYGQRKKQYLAATAYIGAAAASAMYFAARRHVPARRGVCSLSPT